MRVCSNEYYYKIYITAVSSLIKGERSIVVIESAAHQGTGTYIRVHNKCFILTCAHVVGKVNIYTFCSYYI